MPVKWTDADGQLSRARVEIERLLRRDVLTRFKEVVVDPSSPYSLTGDLLTSWNDLEQQNPTQQREFDFWMNRDNGAYDVFRKYGDENHLGESFRFLDAVHKFETKTGPHGRTGDDWEADYSNICDTFIGPDAKDPINIGSDLVKPMQDLYARVNIRPRADARADLTGESLPVGPPSGSSDGATSSGSRDAAESGEASGPRDVDLPVGVEGALDEAGATPARSRADARADLTGESLPADLSLGEEGGGDLGAAPTDPPAIETGMPVEGAPGEAAPPIAE